MKNESTHKEITWEVPEYDMHERSRNWYIVASIIAALLFIYAIISSNYLFIIIIILTVFLVIAREKHDVNKIIVMFGLEGLNIGKAFYDYDLFKNFSIVFKPHQNVKNLYLEFKNPIRQRISISLENMDPLIIKEFLLKFLEEDLERTDIPLSESLAKLFRL